MEGVITDVPSMHILAAFLSFNGEANGSCSEDDMQDPTFRFHINFEGFSWREGCGACAEANCFVRLWAISSAIWWAPVCGMGAGSETLRVSRFPSIAVHRRSGLRATYTGRC